MTVAQRARGQPLLFMAVIIGSWLTVRALLWELPIQVHARPAGSFVKGDDAKRAKVRHEAPDAEAGRVRASDRSWTGSNRRDLSGPAGPAGPTAIPLRRDESRRSPASSHPGMLLPPRRAADLPPFLDASGRVEALSPVAGYRAGAERPRAAAMLAAADSPLLGTGLARDEAKRPRWSGDAWVSWREGSGAAAAPGVVAYGRSQAGAVLRYRLKRGSALRPAAYVRATGALQSPRQAEVAAGLAVRPAPALPVSFAVEARVSDTDTGRQVRPAAFAVTELPPAALPLGLRAEAYVQAGYVGGRYNTAFVDGQARIDRPVFRLGDESGLRVGVAAWGGAQRGTSRLDVGPSATLGIRMGGLFARLAADYRFRAAGDAAPASGPAVTFSAGF